MAKTFLFTLDEDLYGDKMQTCTDRLFKMKIPATIFIDHKTSMSRGYINLLKAQNFDLQMHWIRFPRGLPRIMGFEEPSFIKQKTDLESLLDIKIMGNRTHGLDWRAPYPRKSNMDFVYPWFVMQEAGIKWSSSTTGFPTPFKPFSIEGKPFELTEIPVTHYERIPTYESSLVVGLYHPHYDKWREAAEYAVKAGYTFNTVSDYLDNIDNG